MRIKFFLILLLSFTGIYAVDIIDPAGKKVKEGVRRYREGDFQTAQENFRSAGKSFSEKEKRIPFNEGTAEFKLNEFDKAIQSFTKASETDDKELKAKSLYNLGNTYLKKGEKLQAMKSYLDSLKADSKFEPARKNLELLRKEEEKKQDQQQNQDHKENEENEKNQPKPDDKKNQSNKKQKSSDEENNSEQKQDESGLTKEEAERIMDSARPDQIKRRKKLTKRGNNDFFW
ncbi:MAG: hypothetical protein SFU98_15515 [Leptospiraceae bacterium]|nr:hypothetical protein [Leptospiraceae bacterium]